MEKTEENMVYDRCMVCDKSNTVLEKHKKIFCRMECHDSEDGGGG